MTTNRDIPFAKSLVDYIFRWMGIQFIPGYREANTPRRETPVEPVKMKERELAALSGHEEGETEAPGRRAGPTSTTRMPGVEARTARPDTPLAGDTTLVQRHLHVERRGDATILDIETRSATGPSVSALAEAMKNAGDGPPCEVCGTITVRNGTCHKCVNCGASLGCS